MHLYLSDVQNEPVTAVVWIVKVHSVSNKEGFGLMPVVALTLRMLALFQFSILTLLTHVLIYVHTWQRVVSAKL